MPARFAHFLNALLVTAFYLWSLDHSLLHAEPEVYSPRLIDLFQRRDDQLHWQKDFEGIGNKMIIKNEKMVLSLSDDSLLEPLRLYYQDEDGNLQALSFQTRSDVAKALHYYHIQNGANALELVNGSLILSRYKKSRITFVSESLKAGAQWISTLLIGGSILPEGLSATKIGKKMRLASVEKFSPFRITQRWARARLEKNHCRSSLAAIGSHLVIPAAAVIAERTTRPLIENFDLEREILAIRHEMAREIRILQKLQNDSASPQRDFEIQKRLEKVLMDFERLKLLAHRDSLDTYDRYLGRHSSGSSSSAAVPTFFAEFASRVNDDRRILNATFSFTQMDDAKLTTEAKRLRTSTSDLRRKVQKLKEELDQFKIISPDSDLRRYQQMRRESFSNFKSFSEFSKSPLITGGDPTYDEQGNPVILDDLEVRIGFESRLLAEFYRSLYAEKFDVILSRMNSEWLNPSQEKASALDPRPRLLSLAEGLEKSARSASEFNRLPKDAFERFIDLDKTFNAIDVVQAEVGFLDSLRNLEMVEISSLKTDVEEEAKLIREKNFHALASRYITRLNVRLRQQFDAIVFEEQLLNPEPTKTTQPEEVWASMTHSHSGRNQTGPSNSR